MMTETKSLHDEILEVLPEGNLNDYIEIDGIIIHETAKAVLVAFTYGMTGYDKEVWLPKSQIAKMDDGCYRRFLATHWIAGKNRLE